MQEALQSNTIFHFWIKGEEDLGLLKMYPIHLTEKYVCMCTQPSTTRNPGCPTTSYTREKYEQLKDSSICFYFPISDIIPFDDYSDSAWDKYSDCEGCRYGYSNQQGHTCI